MQRGLLREAVFLALANGLLKSDSPILFDGEVMNPEPDQDPVWRPDGYSIETNLGCRKIRVVEDMRAELANGDEAERQVAENFPAWFCFEPMQLHGFTDDDEWKEADPEPHSLEAEDEAERRTAARASDLRGILHYWFNVSDDHMDQFIVYEDTDGDGRLERRTEPLHRTVFAGKGTDVAAIPDRWPARALDLMAQYVVAARGPARNPKPGDW